VFLITSVSVERVIVHKDLLVAVSKALLFAKDNVGVKLHNAVFDKGVYRINLSGLSLPDKPFVEDIVGEHVLCKDVVELVLDADPDSRDDDLRLLLAVWNVQGVNIDLTPFQLEYMFNAESITRARRKIQNNEGKFPPTSYAVAKRRGINEELLREYYGKGD